MRTAVPRKVGDTVQICATTERVAAYGAVKEEDAISCFCKASVNSPIEIEASTRSASGECTFSTSSAGGASPCISLRAASFEFHPNAAPRRPERLSHLFSARRTLLCGLVLPVRRRIK